MDSLLKKKISQSGKISDEEFQFIAKAFEPRDVLKGELLVSEGKRCQELYFINNGMIRTFVNHDGEEVTTWVALAGTVETSAKAFVRQIPSEANLQAISDCSLLALSRKDYYRLLSESKAFNIFANRMMEDFYLRMEDRFHSYLFLSARERYEKMKKQYPKLFTDVPLKYVASILRIKPETLSRIRTRY